MPYRSRLRPIGIGLGFALLLTGLSGCGSTPTPSATPSANANDLVNAGLHALTLGHTDEAVADFKAALAIDPQNLYGYYNLGVIAQGAGKGAEAEKDYRRALVINPDYPPALSNLAILRTAAAPWEAIDLYRHLIAVDPKNANAHLNLGYALIGVNLKSEGQAEIQKALQLNPSLARTPTPTATP